MGPTYKGSLTRAVLHGIPNRFLKQGLYIRTSTCKTAGLPLTMVKKGGITRCLPLIMVKKDGPAYKGRYYMDKYRSGFFESDAQAKQLGCDVILYAVRK